MNGVCFTLDCAGHETDKVTVTVGLVERRLNADTIAHLEQAEARVVVSMREDDSSNAGVSPPRGRQGGSAQIHSMQQELDHLRQRLGFLEATLSELAAEMRCDSSKGASQGANSCRAGDEPMRADYYNIWRLLQSPRELCESEIRALCRSVFLGDYTSLCRVLGRYKMYVDTRDIGIAAHLLMDGFWEMWVTEAMMRHVRQGMTVLDVGANLGYFSLLLADLTGPTGRVLSFEPNPHMSSLARRSLEINGFSPWSTLHEVALGDSSGEVQFSARLDHPGGAHVVVGGEGAFSVPVRRLDAIPGALDADFIKMDVEGYEHHVWRGMTQILARKRPLTIFMEFNISRFENPRGFLEEIAGHGFSSRIVDFQQGVIPVSRDELFDQSHTADHMLVFERA